MPSVEKNPSNLAPAPSRVFGPNRQHPFFHRLRGPPRGTPRTPGAIQQSRHPGAGVTPQPLVACLATYSESATQRRHLNPFSLGQTNKLLSTRHGGTLLPRHADPPSKKSAARLKCYPCLRTPVTHVPGLYSHRAGGKGVHFRRPRCIPTPGGGPEGSPVASSGPFLRNQTDRDRSRGFRC